MKVSLVIPTRNRANLWATRFLWQWILDQTDQRFSVCVVDDMSTDGTSDVVAGLMKDAPFPCKLCRVIEPRLGEWQASPVSDNVAFRECIRETEIKDPLIADPQIKGWGVNLEQTIVIHIDDDGRVPVGLVAAVKRLYAEHAPANPSPPGPVESPVTLPVYYGMIVYADVENGKIIKMDDRLNANTAHKVTRIDRADNKDWGALWAAPLSLIHSIGGHNMNPVEIVTQMDGKPPEKKRVSMASLRGADSRLGWQFHQRVDTWFAALEEMTFVHRGLSGYQAALRTGNDWEFNRNVYAPWRRGNHVPPIVSNGGPEFWGEKAFPIKYEVVFTSDADRSSGHPHRAGSAPV